MGSQPQISSQCGQCPWVNPCQKWADQTDDMTLLFYVGGAMKSGLRQLGISSVAQLANLDPQFLISKIPELKQSGFLWPSFPPKLMEDAVRRARVRLSNRHVLHIEPIFPKAAVEIHYDIEDDPTQDFVYLHGLILKIEGQDPQYHSFFADTRESEEKVVQDLFAFFQFHSDAIIYHYSHHEKATLKRLCEKYPSLNRQVYDLIFGSGGRSVDLYQWVSENSDWPLTSYGLKAICKYLGFKWATEDAGGANSILWVNDYLKGNVAQKAKILRYNEDDCRATLFLKQRLLDLWTLRTR